MLPVVETALPLKSNSRMCKRFIQATDSAFAALLADGSVVAWGEDQHGGDVSAVQQQLKDVEGIVSSSWPFAAIPANGSVVT